MMKLFSGKQQLLAATFFAKKSPLKIFDMLLKSVLTDIKVDVYCVTNESRWVFKNYKLVTLQRLMDFVKSRCSYIYFIIKQET